MSAVSELMNGMSDVFSAIPPPSNLSFKFSDLEVLFDALFSYRDKLEEEHDIPDHQVYYTSDGSSYHDIIEHLISIFMNYSFK